MAIAVLLAIGLPLAAVQVAAARDDAASSPQFDLNENTLRAVSIATSVDVKDPRSVLHALLSQVAPIAEVFPSENYYYFSFYDHGQRYMGSLRLAAESRDQGMLDLNYNKYYGRIQSFDAGVETTLSAKDGVAVTKVDDHSYRISYGDASAVFKLHELVMTMSPGTALNKGEVYVGSLYDESGIEFDLIYSRIRKNFLFLLKPDRPGVEPLKDIGDHLMLGNRTGFIYFDDKQLNRKVLVAVNAEDVYENTYFDGPFDQLPENYYDKIRFFQYVFQAYPYLKTKLNAFGSYSNGDIYALFAYRQYRKLSDLHFARRCQRLASRDQMYNCLLDQP